MSIKITYNHNQLNVGERHYYAGDLVTPPILPDHSDQSQFNTCVILGFGQEIGVKNPAWHVLLARPYAVAQGIGSACPHALVGLETIKIPVSNLRSWSHTSNGGK